MSVFGCLLSIIHSVPYVLSNVYTQVQVTGPFFEAICGFMHDSSINRATSAVMVTYLKPCLA